MNSSPVPLWFLVPAALLSVRLAQANILTTHPYIGITCITRTEASPWPVTMHIVMIDLAAPGLGFKLTPPGGARETVRQTTLDFLNQEHAQVAINAHFFLPFPPADTNDFDANVVGFAASQGVVYSPFEPQPIGTDYVDQSYAILSYAPALNIDPSNRASIVHRDPAYADNQHVLEPVTLWNAVAGSAQIISNGAKTIPAYSGPPDGLNPISGYDDNFHWYLYPEARTCIGLTRDNESLVLFTVDDAGDSFGLSVSDAADLLISEYHVYDALNLDGGGSTTMVLQDPNTHTGQILNISADNPQGRATASNLAVFAEPVAEPRLRLALTLTPTRDVIISWPASATDWQLQHSPDLNPANWTNLSACQHQIGDCVQVIVPRQAASEFYRLMK